jgi:hypothetical protein
MHIILKSPTKPYTSWQISPKMKMRKKYFFRERVYRNPSAMKYAKIGNPMRPMMRIHSASGKKKSPVWSMIIMITAIIFKANPLIQFLVFE